MTDQNEKQKVVKSIERSLQQVQECNQIAAAVAQLSTIGNTGPGLPLVDESGEVSLWPAFYDPGYEKDGSDTRELAHGAVNLLTYDQDGITHSVMLHGFAGYSTDYSTLVAVETVQEGDTKKLVGNPALLLRFGWTPSNRELDQSSLPDTRLNNAIATAFTEYGDFLNYIRGVYGRDDVNEEEFNAARARFERSLRDTQPEGAAPLSGTYWERWGYKSRDESIQNEKLVRQERAAEEARQVAAKKAQGVLGRVADRAGSIFGKH